MKKKITLIIIILLTFLLACFTIYKTTDKEEYNLIEITGQEFINSVLEGNNDMILALYNERDVQAESFMQDLEKTVDTSKENIYYLNTSHTTVEVVEIISSLTTTDPSILSYIIIENDKIALNQVYKDYKTMLNDLNGHKYETVIKKTPKEEKLESIKKAQEEYKKGDIAAAYFHLANAWDIKEAKDEYNNNKYYQILGSWEIHDLDKDRIYTNYTNFYFMNHSSLLYIAHKKDKFDGFEKPVVQDYKYYDVLIKDDYIYMKNEKNNKYEKKYEIISIDKYSLRLKDKNKEYHFQYGY